MIGLDEFHLSHHFLSRTLDMGITPEQIREVLINPDEIAPSRKYSGCLNYRRGDLCFAVDPEGPKKTVITALWSNREAWERDMEIGGYERKRGNT